MIFELLTASVITAGSGRGFVVESAGERLAITAAHCLPFFPPAQSFFEPKERIYGPLLARLGDEPHAWAVCRFVDPIADIAVLGPPAEPHADEYQALMETATVLSIGGSLRNPVNFWVPARLLSLDGHRWFSCTVRHFGGPLWITHAAEGIRNEMSGSPIVHGDWNCDRGRVHRRGALGGWSQPTPHPQPAGMAVARHPLIQARSASFAMGC
jgi:hypothetical protein